MGIIYWPGDVGERERLALKKAHGDDAVVTPYDLYDAFEPYGIVNRILADPTSFVYVPSGVHALVASERRLRFGIPTYSRHGLVALHHFDPSLPRAERLNKVWAWRNEEYAVQGISLN